MPVSKNIRKNGKSVSGKVPAKLSRGAQFIKEAREIQSACRNLIANSANVGKLVAAAEANPEITLDHSVMTPLISTLNTDLRKLKEELATIDATVESNFASINSKTDDIEVMTITVDAGNSYQAWQERFLQITAPVLEQITNICTGEENVSND